MRPPEKPCEYTTLNRALSLLTPDSAYARYRPSRILALGAVTGGPPGVPHGVGGGGRTAFTNHPAASAAAMRTSRPAGVLPVPDSQSIAQAAQMSRRTPTHACIADTLAVRFSRRLPSAAEASAAIIGEWRLEH